MLASIFLAMLAGCVSEPEPEPECEDEALCDLDTFLSDHYCVQNDLPRVYAPDVPDESGAIDPWVIGDHWTYSIDATGQEPRVTRLVYYDIQDNGAHYMVGTPTREEALEHAVFSTNPVIGRVHKTLYSPHESGSHADMFNFPLCAGNTWTDVYYATPFTFTVEEARLQIPGGSDAGYRIVGTADDGSTVVITYSPAVKWFTSIDLDRADGLQVDMRLTDFGSGQSGPAYFLRGQQDEMVPIARTTVPASNVVEREDGKEGPYDTMGVFVDLEREGSGKVELRLTAPDGTRMETCVGLAGDGLGGDTDCIAPPALFEVPYDDGQWTFDLSVPVLGTTAASADIRVASIYDRSGSS